MSEAKIEIKIGRIQFSGEGGQDWVARQLDKILSQAEKLMQIAAPDEEDDRPEVELKGKGKKDSSVAQKTLAAFLGEKSAKKNQVKKFLATAVWLHAKGSEKLRTMDVTSALSQSSQQSLGNPSMCLNNNVKKGYCQKIGNEFYVTQEGKESL
jgi:hypothetical protein